ncbi:unnamed protein product, partial [Prorocentrum cordatum]
EHAGGRPGGRRDPALDGAAEALAARRTSQGALGALRRTLLAGPRGAPLSAVARCAGTARRGGVGAASGGAEAAEDTAPGARGSAQPAGCAAGAGRLCCFSQGPAATSWSAGLPVPEGSFRLGSTSV